MHFSFEFLPEQQFDAYMPEQFFVRAMHSNTGLFLTEQFLSDAYRLGPEELADHLIDDLNREREGDPNPYLLLYYLFTDFRDEFKRMILMKKNGRPKGNKDIS